MKKYMCGLVGGLAGIAFCATAATATPVYVDLGGDSSVSVSTTDTGLSVVFGYDFAGLAEKTSITAGLAAGFGTQTNTLYEGASPWQVDFLTFSVTGNGLGTFDVDATFGFDTPAGGVDYSGDGGWGTVTIGKPWPNFLRGTWSAGALWWDDPIQTLTLADGNVLQIELEQGFVMGGGGEYTLSAYITNLGGGGDGQSAPVPEPTTMLLFGVGLAGLAGMRLRKK